MKRYVLPRARDPQNTKAVSLQQPRQRQLGEEPQVLRRCHQAPSPAEKPSGERAEVARRDDQSGAWPGVPVDDPQHLVGRQEVLDDVEHDPDVEGTTAPVERAIRLLNHIQAARAACGYRLARQLDAADFKRRAGFLEEVAVGAADLQEPAIPDTSGRELAEHGAELAD